MIISPLYVRKGEAFPATMGKVIVKHSMGHMAKIGGRSRLSEGMGYLTGTACPASSC
jgi:hypothetical protein